MYYSFVSYVKILRFYKKKILIGPLLGEVRFFRVILGLRRMKKKFELGQKNFLFFFSFVNPLYEPILVFPKFSFLCTFKPPWLLPRMLLLLQYLTHDVDYIVIEKLLQPSKLQQWQHSGFYVTTADIHCCKGKHQIRLA